MMSACSDFLDREPMTTPNSETFLSNASAVNNYINGLYIALPSLGTYDMGVRGEEKNSDNIVAEVYDKRLNGELLETGGGTAEWQNGYQNLRNVNYFFEYYKVPEAEETKDVLSLKGEAYFFRAYWHFYLLTRFGSIPVMDKFWDGNATG
ncbi:RagB/SusD family nutrient uptake outer membrane protein, partial [Bacteroides finegoldii]